MDKKINDIIKLLLAGVTNKDDLKVLKALLPEVIDHIINLKYTNDISDQDYAFPKIFIKVYCETKENDYAKVFRALVYWHKDGLPEYFVINNGNVTKEMMINEFAKSYKDKLKLMSI
jgi:hypothetical protein